MSPHRTFLYGNEMLIRCLLQHGYSVLDYNFDTLVVRRDNEDMDVIPATMRDVRDYLEFH